MHQRILMRAGRPPHDTTSNEGAFAWRGGGHFATNSGNLLYSDSVYRTLRTPAVDVACDAFVPQSRRLTDAEIERVNAEHDVYVLPLANAFREQYAAGPLERLTDFVSRLTIPVVVTGVGGQAPLGGGISALPDRERANTVAFVRAVLEHGPSIGVRGEITRQMLLDLGFADADVDVIGCPSMYANDRDFRVERRTDRLHPGSPLATSLESYQGGGELGELWRANEAEYADLVAVYQTMPGGELVLWGQEAPELPEGTPRSVRDRAYLEGRMRFFTNPRPWRQFLRTRDFAFGIRIHGNVAALSAGTPAYLLSVDTRTQELADYHRIPTAPLTCVMESGRYLARDLHDDMDLDALNRVSPENWDRWTAFLERHGLQHVHQPGRENPAYDALVAAADMPDGIRPIGALDPEGISSRLRWLWQSPAEDRHRPHARFEPASDLATAEPGTVAQELAALRQEVDRLTRQTEKLRARVRTQARASRPRPSSDPVKPLAERPLGARARDAVRRRLGQG